MAKNRDDAALSISVHTYDDTEFRLDVLGRGTGRETLKIGEACIFFYRADLLRLRDAIDVFLAQPRTEAA